jgi:nucleotide-binding universal stress UspA family protein
MHKNILIATDGSELANKAVGQGLELARQLGAHITLVTATEDWSARIMAQRVDEGINNPIEEFRIIADAHAANVLASVAAKASASGVSFQTAHAREAIDLF